jgi:hypothetical protein
MRVSGHIPVTLRAHEAVEQGYDEIQHINQVLLNFYVKPDTDTRSLQRFTLIAENANSLDLDAQPFQDLLRLFVAHKTVLDPTLTAFEAQFTQMPGELNPSFAAIKDHLPITLRRGLYKSESEITKEMAPRWRASYAKMLEAVARFHRAGIQIVSGTDNVAGFAFQRELELYVKAGIPANEVLRIATWNGATYARVLSDRGSIERGKRADLILVDGDPTKDISSIRSRIVRGNRREAFCGCVEGGLSGADGPRTPCCCRKWLSSRHTPESWGLLLPGCPFSERGGVG